MKQIFSSLGTKFILGASLLLALISATLFIQLENTHITRQLNQLQHAADVLQLQVERLKQKAHHYKTNAPRDFQSYFRDVQLFYSDLQSELKSIDDQLSELPGITSEISQSYLFSTLNNQMAIPFGDAVSMQGQWQENWIVIKEELAAKMGNPKEPRLEWGADYILEQHNALATSSARLSESIQESQDWFTRYNNYMTYGSLGTVLVYILLISAWFMIRVIQPVRSTAAACQAVASGEYGLQIDSSRNDEIGLLQSSFNELSARSEFMMELLKDLNKPSSVKEKLLLIHESGKNALQTNWCGIIEFGTDKAALTYAAPSSLAQQWRSKKVDLLGSFGHELSKAAEFGWIRMNRQEMHKHISDERFIRELQQVTMATDMAGFPITVNNRQSLLLVTTRQETGFSQQQIQLIRALSRLIAEAMASSESKKADASAA